MISRRACKIWLNITLKTLFWCQCGVDGVTRCLRNLTYTPGKKFLQKFSKLIFHNVRHWVASCQFDYVMEKSTISQQWQVIGMKAAGATVSHIAQTMQMSQRTMYSILRRHREKLRWCEGPIMFREKARNHYCSWYFSWRCILHPILHIGFHHQNWQCDKIGVLCDFYKTGKKWTSLVCYGCFPKYTTSGSRNSHLLYSWHCNAGNQRESEH